jgi:hypothetical protein
MVVLLHPSRRAGTPTSSHDIGQRLSEISFSSAFFTELSGLALAKREAENSTLAFGSLERRLRQLNIHMIDANELMEQLTNLSKLNTQASFIGSLFQQAASAPPNGWSRTSPRSVIHPPSTWAFPSLNRLAGQGGRTIVHFCLYFAA